MLIRFLDFSIIYKTSLFTLLLNIDKYPYIKPINKVKKESYIHEKLLYLIHSIQVIKAFIYILRKLIFFFKFDSLFFPMFSLFSL